MAKPKRPAWFKVFLDQKTYIDVLPAEKVGNVIKAAFHYFDDGELKQLETDAEMMLFAGFKKNIDESFTDYNDSVKHGKKGGRPRKEKPPVKPPNLDQPTPTEAEADAEADASEKWNNENNADKVDEGTLSASESIMPPDGLTDAETRFYTALTDKGHSADNAMQQIHAMRKRRNGGAE